MSDENREYVPEPPVTPTSTPSKERVVEGKGINVDPSFINPETTDNAKTNPPKNQLHGGVQRPGGTPPLSK